jgi:hypothetical protein
MTSYEKCILIMQGASCAFMLGALIFILLMRNR